LQSKTDHQRSTRRSIIKPFAQTHVEKYFRIAYEDTKLTWENYVEKRTYKHKEKLSVLKRPVRSNWGS